MESAMRASDTSPDSKMNSHPGKLALAGATESLFQAANEFVSNFKYVSDDAVKDSVSFAKRYPIHTAIGAATIGFFIGMFVRKI